MRKNCPSECRCALLGPIFFHPLTAAPAVQRYLVAPAEAILALPIKNQKSKFNNRQSSISSSAGAKENFNQNGSGG
jgi:hypothetical protein